MEDQSVMRCCRWSRVGVFDRRRMRSWMMWPRVYTEKALYASMALSWSKPASTSLPTMDSISSMVRRVASAP